MRRLGALAAALWGAAAAACPVCGLGASDQSQGAYIGMSIVISLVPLACIGGIAAWVALRMRAHRKAEEAAQAQEGPRLTRLSPQPHR